MFEYESEPDGIPASRHKANVTASPADDGADILPPKSGLYHTSFPLDEIFYKKSPDEKVVQNAGSFIVLGSDRPGSDRDGYGTFASGKAASIDLVVGRMSSANKGDGPNRPAWVDNSFSADAARIHISQLTDIDHNFGLAENSSPQSISRSGIGIKADAVRIIGREGVKIISGGGQGVEGFSNKGETNSLGGKIRQPSPEISLIAGNSTEDRVVWGGFFNPRERIKGLQPIPLGYATRDAFMELSEILDLTIASIQVMLIIQEALNGILGIDPLRPWVPIGTAWANAMNLIFVSDTLFQLRANKFAWEHNYLWPSGYKFICSRNVKTT